jgi:hypothetical protein
LAWASTVKLTGRESPPPSGRGGCPEIVRGAGNGGCSSARAGSITFHESGPLCASQRAPLIEVQNGVAFQRLLGPLITSQIPGVRGDALLSRVVLTRYLTKVFPTLRSSGAPKPRLRGRLRARLSHRLTHWILTFFDFPRGRQMSSRSGKITPRHILRGFEVWGRSCFDWPRSTIVRRPTPKKGRREL